MNDLTVMQRAVASDPDCPFARLAYADALEEAGRDGRLQRTIASAIADGPDLDRLQPGAVTALSSAIGLAYGAAPHVPLRFAFRSRPAGCGPKAVVCRQMILASPSGDSIVGLVTGPWNSHHLARRRGDSHWVIESTAAVLLDLPEGAGHAWAYAHPDAYARWFTL